MSWYQPFVQLPRLSAAAAGPEALSPQGAFTVVVQQPLPLIKVRRAVPRNLLPCTLCCAVWVAALCIVMC